MFPSAPKDQLIQAHDTGVGVGLVEGAPLVWWLFYPILCYNAPFCLPNT